MRIQCEYMSFNHHWTISSSYDVQAHQPSSQKICVSLTAVLWFDVLPDLSSAILDLMQGIPGLLLVLRGLSSALPDVMQAHPDLLSALRGVSLVLPELSLALPKLSQALPGASRRQQCSLQHSEVFPNLSQSLPWYSYASHHRSQLLGRPAGMPTYGLFHSCNRCIHVYTPDPLRQFWRLPETKIHFADEHHAKTEGVDSSEIKWQ